LIIASSRPDVFVAEDHRDFFSFKLSLQDRAIGAELLERIVRAGSAHGGSVKISFWLVAAKWANHQF
jgi:hypothetical protein